MRKSITHVGLDVHKNCGNARDRQTTHRQVFRAVGQDDIAWKKRFSLTGKWSQITGAEQDCIRSRAHGYFAARSLKLARVCCAHYWPCSHYCFFSAGYRESTLYYTASWQW